MASRVGIELSHTACRIVEIDSGPPWRRGQGHTRVRSFVVLPPSGPETRARLESLRRRQAGVVVWGGRTEHRQVMVTGGSYESMRTEALAALSAAGVQTSGVLADIAIVSPADHGSARRSVLVSLAANAHVMEALLPLRQAGIRLRTVTTPAVALMTLARLRQPLPSSDALEAYIACDGQATCIALMRAGTLLAARDVPWGFIDADYTRSQPRSRDDIASRLAEALVDFVRAIGGSRAAIGQVCICGGLPDLRSMSTLLMERLDVEVEPLDSLFGIDPGRLPPGDEFRERAAELRLAWSAAAEWPPTMNLLRARRRQASTAWLARAAVVAGAAAGLSGSWLAVERGHLWPARRSVPRAASTPAARGAPAPVAPVAPRLNRSGGQGSRGPAAAPPILPAQPPAERQMPAPAMNKAPMVTPERSPVDKPSGPVSSALAAAARPPAVVPPSAATTPGTAVEGRSPATANPVVRPPASMARTAPVSPRSDRGGRPSTAAAPARVDPAPFRVRPPSEEPAQPFDAVLGTILYARDRQLAIVDNRIVGVGDEVRGARVVEITAASVTLRDARGQLKRLTLAAAGR